MNRLSWLLLVPLVLCGCAGGKVRVVTRSVQTPVSYTPCVFDSSGRIRRAHTNEVVKHFEISKANWSMLWTALPLNAREWDISPALNAQLQQASGNAVVNLTVQARGCDFLHWYIASLVPIIPSYVAVKIEGDVVRIPEHAP